MIELSVISDDSINLEVEQDAKYPSYTGSYEVVPTMEDVVLPTEGKSLESDIVIEAIGEDMAKNLLFYDSTKGYRTLSGSISGDGTDPNWVYWPLASCEGFTKIKYYLYGYTTIASIFFADENGNKVSDIHASGSQFINGTADIPEGAKYIGISCRALSYYAYQFAILTR